MGKQVNISDEERERRRERMMQLHAEGRAGPEYGKMGGRPRKPRASEQIAEKVVEDAEAFYQRLKEIGLEGGEKNAVGAILALLKIEEQERKIVVQQEEKIDQLRREDLLELVATQLRELTEAGTLPVIEAGPITIGDAEVVRDERPTEDGESPSGD